MINWLLPRPLSGRTRTFFFWTSHMSFVLNPWTLTLCMTTAESIAPVNFAQMLFNTRLETNVMNDAKWRWKLQGQKYPVYVLPNVPESQTLSLFALRPFVFKLRPFSDTLVHPMIPKWRVGYHIYSKKYAIMTPLNDFKHYSGHSYLMYLLLVPTSRQLTPFSSTLSDFQDIYIFFHSHIDHNYVTFHFFGGTGKIKFQKYQKFYKYLCIMSIRTKLKFRINPRQAM